MNIVLKTGASSLLLRDALRRPLAELELGEVDASLRRVDSNVTRVRPNYKSNTHLLESPHCQHMTMTWTLDQLAPASKILFQMSQRLWVCVYLGVARLS